VRTAQLRIPALEFVCPVCLEYISNDDDGSHLFLGVPKELECLVCNIKLKVPARARKILNR
jgi:hypothetical protein